MRLAVATLLLAVPRFAVSQSAVSQSAASPSTVSQSAKISNVRYDVTFDSASAASRLLHVTMTMDVAAGTDPVLLSLPAWTPGAYELSWFARWVRGFTPRVDGRVVAWDKADYDTWRIDRGSAQRLTVSFDYLADSLDNAMAWARPDFALFNGTNVFLYPEGQSLDFPATVTVHTTPGWRIVTGMTQSSGGATPTYSATNYDDLADMPFFVGRFDVDSQQVSGKWIRYATYPMGSVRGETRRAAWSYLAKVIPAEIAVFNEAPWANYSVMQIADSSFQGASGLEHQSSHVDIITPLAVGSDFIPSLYAHEIFHSWNVKRLRPADMWPYVYDRAMPTPWLWVSEGITDYYADLAEVRSGVYDAESFWRSVAGKMSEVASVPPVALEDASLSTWIHPVDGTAYIYYPKGSLAGLALDLMIRDATDNAQSLDDVMRQLYEADYQHGRGFTADDWWGAISQRIGAERAREFAARYIDGREPFPWDSLLARAGMRIVTTRVPRLGVTTEIREESIVITAVDSGGAAAAAGAQPGDQLVTVGDIDVRDQDFGERFREKYAKSSEGSAMPIVVRRAGRMLRLQGKLRFVPGDPEIEPIPGASAKALRVRNGILRGVTGAR